MECPYTTDQLQKMAEIGEIEGDIRELCQRERNLRQARKNLVEYVEYWQKQIKRLDRDILSLEKERLSLEASEILQEQKKDKETKSIDAILAQFSKMSTEQQAKLMANLKGE